ncbi:hypothetical protein [Rubellimicrobium aerolatum]|uniref:Uncharacterized protein n=1 Tax=Rubellimicrobium aerolatum TaxID=490979 RepID=A0ABW0SC20_9RHOB|nr:hypothetical protein [Rubellimicrobium aerolatum]MBP1806206.1 hypothetical protein [Rubellimicrobium aerolatum]
MDFALAQDPAALLAEAMRQAATKPEERSRDGVLLDLVVFTRIELPSFGQTEAGAPS